MKHRIAALVALVISLFVWATACGAPEESIPYEPVGEADDAVIGASCTNDASCGSPFEHCCGSALLKFCYSTHDDHHCGSCSTDCAVGHGTAIHCNHGTGAFCVQCNADADCSGGKTCSSGSCVCPSGQTDCSGTCKNLQTDNSNCGSCGNVCSGGKHCSLGSCVCQTGWTDCSGTCQYLPGDSLNCGSCGNVCTGGTYCHNGACVQCVADTECAFKTKCESGVCTGHCIDHTGCNDDQLCNASSVCVTVPAVGATQGARDTYCRSLDGGGNPSTWAMASCNVGGSDICVQRAGNTKHAAGCNSNQCANNANQDVASWSLKNATVNEVGSCGAWESSSCFSPPGSGNLAANCVYKMCPAPAEGSTCLDHWP